jgi:predicted dehydrogenase
MSEKLKFGIIGCGAIANIKHMPALKSFSGKLEMTAFCDIELERAEKAKNEFGGPETKIYENYQELLKNKSIDVVHVCTPNSSHSEITVAALRAGKHVLCEKPMAINGEEAKKMLDAAKETGKLLTIGYQNRYREDVQFLHDACEAGRLGEIYFAKAHAVRRRAVPTWGVFLDKEKQGGGPLIDIGTHALDITLWMMNNYEIDSVIGSVFHKLNNKPLANQPVPFDPAKFQVEDSAFAFIRMKNGATIFLEASWALNTTDEREAMCSLYGTEAGATMKGSSLNGTSNTYINGEDFGKLYELELQTGKDIPFFAGMKENPNHAEVRRWLDAILDGKELVVKPEQAYQVTRILDAVYRSAGTGKTVYF